MKAKLSRVQADAEASHLLIERTGSKQTVSAHPSGALIAEDVINRGLVAMRQVERLFGILAAADVLRSDSATRAAREAAANKIAGFVPIGFARPAARRAWKRVAHDTVGAPDSSDKAQAQLREWFSWALLEAAESRALPTTVRLDRRWLLDERTGQKQRLRPKDLSAQMFLRWLAARAHQTMATLVGTEPYEWRGRPHTDEITTAVGPAARNGIQGVSTARTAVRALSLLSSAQSFSPRQRQVLELLSRRQSITEIARLLEIAEATVRVHMHRAGLSTVSDISPRQSS